MWQGVVLLIKTAHKESFFAVSFGLLFPISVMSHAHKGRNFLQFVAKFLCR